MSAQRGGKTPSGISANFAEMRGRPSRFAPGVVGLVRRLYPEATSERGQRNYCYLLTAVAALRRDGDAEAFEWLLGRARMKHTILYALGRQHWDDETICAAARKMCEGRMRTREALDFIRLINTIAIQDASAHASGSRGE